jgi:hypothetical protein
MHACRLEAAQNIQKIVIAKIDIQIVFQSNCVAFHQVLIDPEKLSSPENPALLTPR